jgi:Na+/H+-dicarboxylate symporter
MDKDFFRNYLQVVGGSFCLLATCLGYVSGFMLVGIQNIVENFKYIGVTGTLASYTLIPLCITVIILGIMNKEKISNLNKTLCISTIIVGFMGTHFYFIIPSIIILYVLYFNNKVEEPEYNDNAEKIEDTVHHKTSSLKDTALNTKIEMAKELLEKNFNKNFISEVTGLTLKEINLIEESNKRD